MLRFKGADLSKTPKKISEKFNPENNGNLFSEKARIAITEALADHPNGRYEKQSIDKKEGRKRIDDTTQPQKSVQDILKEKGIDEAPHPVIKLNGEYYVIFDSISEGAFGKVKYAQHFPKDSNEPGQIYAVKSLTTKPPFIPRFARGKPEKIAALKNQTKDKVYEEAKMEIETLELLERGTGLVVEKGESKLIQRSVDRGGDNETQILILMEYEPGTSLKEIIDENVTSPLPLATSLQIAISSLEDVQFLHSKDRYHCDLKAENIIFDQETGIAKVVDVGSARKIGERGGNPTLAYASPELRSLEGGAGGFAPTEQSEVYAMGVVLAQIFRFGMLGVEADPETGIKPPQTGFNTKLIIDKNKKYDNPIEQQAYDLILKMVDKDSKNRPKLDYAVTEFKRLKQALENKAKAAPNEVAQSVGASNIAEQSLPKEWERIKTFLISHFDKVTGKELSVDETGLHEFLVKKLKQINSEKDLQKFMQNMQDIVKRTALQWQPQSFFAIDQTKWLTTLLNEGKDKNHLLRLMGSLIKILGTDEKTKELLQISHKSQKLTEKLILSDSLQPKEPEILTTRKRNS